jgi:hypothetical protein
MGNVAVWVGAGQALLFPVSISGIFCFFQLLYLLRSLFICTGNMYTNGKQMSTEYEKHDRPGQARQGNQVQTQHHPCHFDNMVRQAKQGKSQRAQGNLFDLLDSQSIGKRHV